MNILIGFILVTLGLLLENRKYPKINLVFKLILVYLGAYCIFHMGGK